MNLGFCSLNKSFKYVYLCLYILIYVCTYQWPIAIRNYSSRDPDL